MSSFVTTFAAALLAGVFLTTGLGHALNWRSFGALLSEHGVVPRRFTALFGLGIAIAELTLGAAASAVVIGTPTVPARSVFAAGIGMGSAFAGYLWHLLRTRSSVSGCGCSPLRGPLTAASLIPGLTAAVAGGLGLAAASMPPVGPDRLLASLWGLALAGVVLLVPATMPRVSGAP